MARDATPSREERLRAALKANIARRKAQGRARAVDSAETEVEAAKPARGANGNGQRDEADG